MLVSSRSRTGLHVYALLASAALPCLFSSALSLPRASAVENAFAADLGHDTYRLKSSFSLSQSLASQWELLDRLPSPNAEFKLSFSLHPDAENTQRLEDILFSNTPEHSHWTRRGHLSQSEVARLAAPKSGAEDRLRMWLELNGISASTLEYDELDAHHSKAFIPRITVAQAEYLLGTRYRVYRHRISGKEIIRALEYSLPLGLHDMVAWVQPTNYFGNTKPARSASTAATTLDSNANVTLADLKSLYNLSAPATSFAQGNKLGITGFLEQYANLADLTEFYNAYLPAASDRSVNVVLVNGASNPQALNQAGEEANLDVQYAGGMSYPVPNVFYSTYGRGQNTNPNISYADSGNEPYDVLLSYLLSLNDTELPTVLSVSYGDYEEDVPLDYAQSVCQQYAQLGARGVSVLHSSGDGGAGVPGDLGNPALACSTPNKFKIQFPSSCPYVTTVGGTFEIPETANTISGGGFSNYFDRPAYQESAVTKYLSAIGSTYSGMYNATGRATPDVSAQSHNYLVYVGGVLESISGTSASTPAFAGIISLLNDALMKQGRQTLGFLNPFFYTTGRAGLNDITTGNNPGCGTPGWYATAGWDPATGNGTPNYGLLLDIMLATNYSDSNPTATSSRSTAQSTTLTGGPTSGASSGTSTATASVSTSSQTGAGGFSPNTRAAGAMPLHLVLATLTLGLLYSL